MASPEDLFAPWQIDPGAPPELVRRSSNEVFRARRDGRTVYLRVTPASYRTAREVQGEIDWMHDLAGAGLRVARPIRSTAGRLCEQGRVAGDPVFLTCLQEAPGRPAEKPADYRPEVIASWATLLADLHMHASRRTGPSGRGNWDEDRVFQIALQAHDPATAPAQKALRTLVTWMQGLATGRDVFGLTHADLHLGNLSVDDDQVTAFDFDDACHHWYLHDVAVAVTSIRKAAWENPGQVDAPASEATFLTHYFARHPLPAPWPTHLEAFVRYRIALTTCWASRAAETAQLDADMLAWYHRSLPWWLAQL